MYMYLQKVLSRKIYFVGVLKVKDVNSGNHRSEAQIRGSGSVPKCNGSTKLLYVHLPLGISGVP
jgi:hypothetical protein